MCVTIMRRALSGFAGSLVCTALCTEVYDMQISEAAGGVPAAGVEPCRFPKLEECAHFHYERVQLPRLCATLQTNMDQSLHSQHANDADGVDWHMIQVTSADECWLVQRSYENFKMLDAQLHQCIYDRKFSQLPDLSGHPSYGEDVETLLGDYLDRFSSVADNSINCGPVLNWFQMDNKGNRLLVPSEESRSINTPAVAAAYSVRRYVSQARDELNLEVGDMISVIDMASPAESVWWKGKRGFQVGFFPQHCVHIIGDKVPRNMPVPPPVVGSLAVTPVKPVLRKHGKLIAFFRSFILNRPSRRRLKQTGILKERVFGCDLGEHLLNSGHDIPNVLKCCAEFIERHGIVDGIYRLSGVTSNIQRLRNAFDEDRVPDLYTEDILQDIHSVASLLKMYFRELPNPLCTYQLYHGFVAAVQGCTSICRRSSFTDHDRLLKMREAVQKLPPPHYRTLEYLARHLSKVAQHGASTGMTTRNIAIVWAPNLLRCAELEVGGVAALQGVGVQAVVTEFLICYADLIFCDRLPTPADDPRRCRPKSLAISTPTKLITLEEARSKLNRSDDSGYIEVGGGPSSLPKKYHTIIELPSGHRKRGLPKRSPSGWRSFFSKSRNNSRSQGSLSKNRKASTPGNLASENSSVEADLLEMKRKLRPVKSAESLTSGHSEPASTEDVLGPLHTLNKPPGHNRSVSHDSYFDTLQQSSQHNSEGSLYDLSEIQINFDLEESEMRIFSEDESLVSSPRIQKETVQRRVLTRARPEEFNSANNSNNPSPKKQARVDASARKRTRLEDQLSDIQYIDCNTPDNVVSTTAVVHDYSNQSSAYTSPVYKHLENSSANTTPGEVDYENLNAESKKSTPTYENVLTTISITYRSPSKSPKNEESVYEDVFNPEQAVVPTSAASLPLQQASQPPDVVPRPKSLSALDDSKSSLSLSEVLHSSTENLNTSSMSFPLSTSKNSLSPNVSPMLFCDGTKTLSEDILTSLSPGVASLLEMKSSRDSNNSEEICIRSDLRDGNPEYLKLTDHNISSNEEDASPACREEAPLLVESVARPVSVNLIEFSPNEPAPDLAKLVANDKRKSFETESFDDENSIYQQVKYFRRSIHEINALLDLDNEPESEQPKNAIENEARDSAITESGVENDNYDSLETDNVHIYENVENSPVEHDDTKPNVRSLTSRFESPPIIQKPPISRRSNECVEHPKIAYDRSSLPPCLRARHAKNAVKTRSLDEDAFVREFGSLKCMERRKSVDENFGSKINTLPKSLNQPKPIPHEDNKPDLHLTHSVDNVAAAGLLPEQKLNRERIEKYKEERRKFLHDKYRSESFKEDKDALLTRLKQKTVKTRCEDRVSNSDPGPASELSRLGARRKCSESDEGNDFRESIKYKTALFECQASKHKTTENNNKTLKKSPITARKKVGVKDKDLALEDMLLGHDFVRKKNEDAGKLDRRRHTYEWKEQEKESDDRIRRISLETRSVRKEPKSPSYCIKDMKAIFESKSQQQQ